MKENKRDDHVSDEIEPPSVYWQAFREMPFLIGTYLFLVGAICFAYYMRFPIDGWIIAILVAVVLSYILRCQVISIERSSDADKGYEDGGGER